MFDIFSFGVPEIEHCVCLFSWFAQVLTVPISVQPVKTFRCELWKGLGLGPCLHFNSLQTNLQWFWIYSLPYILVYLQSSHQLTYCVACCQMLTGPRFTNGFSIAIQIRWKFRFTLTSTLIPWSLQNFVHGTTAVLSWHVQKIVAIWWPATELWQGEVSIVFELRVKNR